jgi:hypothetical protein
MWCRRYLEFRNGDALLCSGMLSRLCKGKPRWLYTKSLEAIHFTQGEAVHARVLPLALNSRFGFDFESEERASK